MDTLLTVEQAAERLGTSPRFVRRLVFERRIAYVKLGRHVRIAARDLDAFIRAGRVEVGQYPTLTRRGLTMATIEKRVRNGRVTYRARYRDPAGGQRSKVFARKADAQRFLNETETAKARAPGPTLRWDGRCSGTGWRSGGRPRRTCVPRPGTGTSCCFDAWPCPASALRRWPRSVSGTCGPGWRS